MNQEEAAAFERSSDDGKLHTIIEGLKAAKGFIAFSIDEDGNLNNVGSAKRLNMAELFGVQAFAAACVKLQEVQLLTQGRIHPGPPDDALG